MKRIALIGSTGSIGKQVLNVVRRYPEDFSVVSLSAGNNEGAFLEQVTEFKPLVATLSKTPCCDGCVLPSGTEYFFGENAFTNAIIPDADIVVVSLVGYKGVIAVLDAINKGKDVALANKESLVVGGEIVTALAKEKGVRITPIDSEHSAVWQALNFDFNKKFSKIILTASGGAFRDYTKEMLESATKDDALKHPNWAMGAKITVDCATLVNKAFEVIEAKWLYNTTFDKIGVIIHRESIIHSMVEFDDGSVIAQMSYPSMEIPIQLALGYPERKKANVNSLDFAALKQLTFCEPDIERFPLLKEVVDAGKMGGLYPAVANGANDMAVELFLQGKIKYGDIRASICGALDSFSGGKIDGFSSLERANAFANEYVKNKFGV
ncbi:MAG: 1-deoxy-D-xylulose-5-phosphate reductoisomerase [Clostridiales bacterium]|nr:1-deoxy-D-xylulose-5-phosphate reductoisomerase [Clostridiales bacterium]